MPSYVWYYFIMALDIIHKKVPQYLRELFPMSSKNNSYKSRSDLNIVRRKSNLNIVIIRDPQTARFDFLHLGVEISPSRIEIS